MKPSDSRGRGGGPLFLGIETSCDETAAAVVAGGTAVLSNIIASQEDLHHRFGGVVPELASRRHLERLLPCVEEALDEAGIGFGDLDGIAVTEGPGLIGSLMVGMVAAKSLAAASGLPLVGVHHLAGHIHACFLAGADMEEPSVALVVSGGHTDLFHLPGDGTVEPLGGTRDDAAGEAFDKVARLLDLGYPGGPAVQRLAEEGDPAAFDFPRAMLRHENFDFSFSGLKTAVLYTIEEQKRENIPVARADIAASFQQAVVDVLVEKTMAAADDLGVRQVLLAGGVASNGPLRRRMASRAEQSSRRNGAPVRLVVPPPVLCTDNGAMIAAAGHYAWARGREDGLLLEVADRMPLTHL